MFRHIVLYRLGTAHKEKAALLCQRFRSMKEKIPQIVEIEAGTDTERTPRSFDLSLSILFQNREDYLQYRKHPYHQEEIAPVVHSITETSVSCDFEA